MALRRTSYRGAGSSSCVRGPRRHMGSRLSRWWAVRSRRNSRWWRASPLLCGCRRSTLSTIRMANQWASTSSLAAAPSLLFGNSDGDEQMLEWTAAGEGPRFMLLVHHTDAVREYAYDRQSH